MSKPDAQTPDTSRPSRALTLRGYLRYCRIAWRASWVFSAVVAGVTFLVFAAPIALIVVIGQIINRLPAALGGGIDSPAAHTVLRLAVLAGAVVAVQWLSAALREAACDALGDRVNHDLQRELMGAVMHPPGVAHLENAATMDLISVGRDTFAQWMRPGRLAWELTLLFSARMMLLGAAVVLTMFSWIAGPLFLAAVLWAEHEGRMVSKKAAENHFDATADSRRAYYFFTLGTEPPGGKEVRMFGLGDFVLNGFGDYWRRAHVDAFSGSSRRERIATATLALVATGTLAWVCVEASRGDLDIGRAAVYAQAVLLGLTSLALSIVSRNRTELALKMMRRHEEAIAAVTAETGPPATGTLTSGTLVSGNPARAIRFEDVTFRYPDNEDDNLRGLDLEIPAGESVAIVGDNGAGKTTLLKLLCGLYPPRTGRILVDGQDLAGLDPKRWQRHIAAVFQDNVRYELPARTNIGFGAVEHQDDLSGIQEAARSADIADVIERLESGWDTVLSSQYTEGSELSGGEFQKVALARALFAVRHGAGVLIMDEPAAHLDARSEARLYERYLELTRGVTTIVVSHRFSTVRQANRIVVVREGRVTEQGTHDELMRRGGYYADMFNLQAANFTMADDSPGAGDSPGAADSPGAGDETMADGDAVGVAS